MWEYIRNGLYIATAIMLYGFLLVGIGKFVWWGLGDDCEQDDED